MCTQPHNIIYVADYNKFQSHLYPFTNLNLTQVTYVAACGIYCMYTCVTYVYVYMWHICVHNHDSIIL